MSAPGLDLLPESAAIDGEDVLIGGCRMSEIAERFGTPAFVIDEEALRRRARTYRESFASRHPRSTVCFACKAYPSPSIIKIMVEEGLGCDVVGAGELRMALLAGADPKRIVMHGNAKTDEDVRAAIEAGIGWIVIDNLDDIDRIARLADRPTPVLIRVIPGVDTSTHWAMATGGKESKFGIPLDQLPAALERIAAAPLIELQGLHAHIGSQILELEPFEAEVAALAELAGVARFTVYDLGGGLGVRYLPEDHAPDIDDYAARLLRAVHAGLGTDIDVLVEPGRSLIAPTGVTLYRVVTVKHGTRTHVAVDGGMGDNLEPSLYGQRFAPLVVGHWDRPVRTVDLVGRHCESGDVLVADTPLAAPEVGDLVLVPVTGAYCFTMSNNYNAALKLPVVLCRDGAARLAVRRETWADLTARELLAPPGPAR